MMADSTSVLGVVAAEVAGLCCPVTEQNVQSRVTPPTDQTTEQARPIDGYFSPSTFGSARGLSTPWGLRQFI